jgi:hypothetical protein
MMDPPSIDRSYPPSMEPVAITSHGARLERYHLCGPGNPARIERRSCYTVIPAGVLSLADPQGERSDGAGALLRLGDAVARVLPRGPWLAWGAA